MADGGRGAKARTWDVARPRGAAWPSADTLGGARDVISRWFATDVAAGRLMPWLPICFGFGIVLYFTADREPSLWAALALSTVFAAAAFFARKRPIAFPLLLALTVAVAGFAIMTLKSARIAHPILQHTAWNISISGFVEVREERERSDRVVVRVHKIEGRLKDAPERVRLSVKKRMAPPVGAFIEVKARLNPPLRPLRPGGYDFSRDLYFQRIGATGFVQGAIKTLDPPVPPGARLRYATFIEGIRDGIDSRIRAAVPGDAGSIASALITGKRDAISAPVNDAMYISSLAHVLSISGYHMALVAGVVFFVVRGLLALSPALAMRHAIKKWAALAALIAAFCYLLLSGAEVATQRSFIMTGIVLVGVMVDRAALTLRNLALAALGVMLLAPEAVVHPSFQMSFAATLALIAAYERGLPWAVAGADTSLGARVALWGGREIVALILASLVAGLATTPYAAYHFHRLAPYGVLANLLAMPIVSVWVMPAGLLALIALPFGFDAPLWRLMGGGIDWMITVALFVANLPGAVGRITAFGTGPLLLCTAGLVVLGLLTLPAALERRGCGRGRGGVGGASPNARCLCGGPRRRGGGARRVGPAFGHAHRNQRRLLGARMARRRCRRPHRGRSLAARGYCLRRDRLCGAPGRRHDGRAAVRRRGLRGGLPPRRAGGQPAHRAAVLRRREDRSHGLAAHRCKRALSGRQRLGDGGGVSGRLRPAVGACCANARERDAVVHRDPGAARCDAEGGGSGAGGLSACPARGAAPRPLRGRLRRAASAMVMHRRCGTPVTLLHENRVPGLHSGTSRRSAPGTGHQYFRNSPTSLPCTRTRLGGRMRTS